jgi:CRISPR/Cas system CSM-associated protein Csm5 (group 7 of RAMP superfamily)
MLYLTSALDLGSGHRFACLLFCLRGKYSPYTHLIGFGGGILESAITLQLMEGALLGEIIMALKLEHDRQLSGKNFEVDS